MSGNPIQDTSVRLWPARSAPFSPGIISGVVALVDGVVVFGTGLVIYLLYVGWSNDRYLIYLSALAIATVLVVAAFHFANLYKLESLTHPAQQIMKIIAVSAMIFLVLVALAFALKIEQFSRVWAFSWFLSATFLICVERTYDYFIFRKWVQAGRLTRNVAIVGGGEQGARLVEALQQQQDPWIHIIGIFDDRSDRTPSTIGGVPVLGNLGNLIRQAQVNRIDDVLVALPWGAEQRILNLVQTLKVLPARIGLSPDIVGLNFQHRGYSHYSGVPVLDIFEKPLTGWDYMLKLIEDRLLSAIIVLFSSPVWLAAAVIIKLDSPGPVFFRQTRDGFNSKLIKVYKFRTMYHDQRDENAETLTTRDDPRVTRVGAFLRRTSLDELPQLINVLRGDMSIVGPRPHALSAKAGGRLYAEAVEDYALRYRVKPGITGWAQVNGWRGETYSEESIRKRVEHDLYYIDNWSLLLDFEIILRTFSVIIRGEKAY